MPSSARRPKPGKLAVNARLHDEVQTRLLEKYSPQQIARRLQLLRVAQDDDDGVNGVDDDLMMRTAPLGVVSGAVVGVVTGWPSG
ncbi:hypothetical protein [Mycolicibacterium agri]|uniref:hypothetical protein n=1 Tax=Mycolicibacterium agri TaxID=36811 RepID=UPI001F1F31FE|nr:hypothetical protein [Mycolicibacterium agri]